jgi:signal transduction histidine kinase
MARTRTAAGPSGYTILVVDDQEEICISNKFLLEREGHQVLTAASGAEALSLFRSRQVHLVIVDYFMPGMSGEEVVQEIRKLDEEVQILLQTGYSGEKPPREMLRTLAIQGYHDKTDGPDRLLLWVEVALKACAQLTKVRETEQLKTRLLANISHELRTPLHIIIGYSEMLLEDERTPLPPHVREPITNIHRYAHSLGFLINNFLNFAKVEAEAMGTALQRVSLADFQEEVQNLMGFLLRGKPVAFVWQVSRQLPPVWADSQKLLLILRNLLSNAAKFTAHGEIQVLATALASGEVALAVQDTGVGIALEYHESIFEVFRQVESSSTRCFDGMGIGLALTRKLARLMGGEIAVESTLGAGATFTVTLKVASDVALPSSPPSLPSA